MRIAISVLVAVFMACSAQAGAVLHYTFDTDLSDSSGSGNDGSSAGSGTAAIVTDARFGAGSVSTDGGTAYVQFTSAITFTTSNAWSCTFWYKAASDTNNQALAGNGQQNNTFRYNVDGETVAGGGPRKVTLRAQHHTDTLTWISSAASPAIDTNVWHHIALSTDGSNNVVTAYEDGAPMNGSWNTDDDTGMVLQRIGGGLGLDTVGFDGQFDEVWVFDHALSAIEVQWLFERNSLNPGGTLVIVH